MMEREVDRGLLDPVADFLLRQIDPVTTNDVVLGLYVSGYFRDDAEIDWWTPTIRIVLRRLVRDGSIENVDGKWRVATSKRSWLTDHVASAMRIARYREDRRAYVLAAKAQVEAGGELPPHPDALDWDFNPRRPYAGHGTTDT